MSRPIVRRITSAVLLLSILCFALPAAAAPAGRAQTSKVPVVFGLPLLDEVVSWLSSLWPGHEPRPQGSQQKAGALVGSGVDTQAAAAAAQDHGGMIDPNGGG